MYAVAYMFKYYFERNRKSRAGVKYKANGCPLHVYVGGGRDRDRVVAKKVQQEPYTFHWGGL